VTALVRAVAALERLAEPQREAVAAFAERLEVSPVRYYAHRAPRCSRCGRTGHRRPQCRETLTLEVGT